MAELVSSVSAKLIEVLGCEAIRNICELWGNQSELAELQETVSTVRMVLLDADTNWDQLSNQDRDFINKLKDVVYDADDVFDEFRTLAEPNKLGKLKKSGKFYAKVRRFFSSKNQVGEAYRMSCEVKDIKKKLDAIAHKKFKLKVDNKPIVRRPKETCSYVDMKHIIGRDKDKEAIINMLLDPNGDEGVRFFSIVGVGGLGKTVLAQLVFNDEKIKQEFSERLWVCVSDQDEEQFDVQAILCKIVGKKIDDTTTFQHVHLKFQEKLKGKKYFLVLDDVWNEDRGKWLELERFLLLGQQGSRILVTSRSNSTTTIIGNGDDHTYMLQGLSEEDSWRLFELTAFTSRPKDDNYEELVNIGKRIIEMCYCVPLAIIVVGSLLYEQHISKWQSFEGIGLAKIEKGNNEILPILKFSYHNLKHSLKSCFNYCALFPKDFRIKKKNIIGMWMAQGYVVSLDNVEQSVEEAAEEHFLILLRRCFFQDVERDEYGDVESVKIHDLMHDVSQEVGEEICIVTSITNRLGDKIRHVNGVGYNCLDNTLCSKNIRSYIGTNGNSVDAQIKNWMRLRILDLSFCYEKIVPNLTGKLLHLRYLDLSYNMSVEVLCESITELYNLQTLNLSWCENLRELPKGISNLVNLSYLDLESCKKLTYMPSGIDKLTNLRVLPLFIVGYKSIENEKYSGDSMLNDLRALNKIQGKLCIKVGDKYRNVEDMNGNEGGYLKSMKYLRVLEIEFKFEVEDNEAILNKLEPPPNVKKLMLEGYKGKRIGTWGAEDNLAISLPLLVHIEISECWYLQQMVMLSNLSHLKSLKLYELHSLEYMENRMRSDSSNTREFFPSLESLEIVNLSKLRGWWKEEVSGLDLIFSHLSNLLITHCPNLVLNLICPNLESLELGG